MNKPILATIGSFTGVSIATLAISYFKYGEFAWLIAIGVGTVIALAMYAFARFDQGKDNSSADPSNSQSE